MQSAASRPYAYWICVLVAGAAVKRPIHFHTAAHRDPIPSLFSSFDIRLTRMRRKKSVSPNTEYAMDFFSFISDSVRLHALHEQCAAIRLRTTIAYCEERKKKLFSLRLFSLRAPRFARDGTYRKM